MMSSSSVPPHQHQHQSVPLPLGPPPLMQPSGPAVLGSATPVIMEPVNPEVALAQQKLELERRARYEDGRNASKWRRSVAATIGAVSTFAGLFSLAFMSSVCDITGAFPDAVQRECQVLAWAWSFFLISIVTSICILLLAIPAMTRHSALDRLHGFFTAFDVICFVTAAILLTVWMHSRYPVSDEASIFTYVLIGVILLATAAIYAGSIAGGKKSFTRRHQFAYHPAGEPHPAWFADAKLRERQMMANKGHHNQHNAHNAQHNNQAAVGY